ncbi:MAG TPA: pitrilysin family protein [Vicinamibacterales bacterium]|nr:pitrilysin family protein [Vicinamibacterales bacterium]
MRRRFVSALLVIVLGTPWLLEAAVQQRNWPSERPPRPIAARDVKFPPYAVKTLANGLEVIAVSHHEQPAVSLRLIVRAGAAQDPDDKPGVAALAATLLDQGTTTRSAEQIANAIDSIGGALGTGAGADLSFINAIVMKDSLSFGLDLVSDVAQHPAFAPDEIERQRQQSLSGMRVSYDDPEFLANVVFDRLVYGLHPYARPQAGTPETLSALTREDLLAFHRKWFGANNAILAIVGDVTPEEAFAGAERAFGKWSQITTTPAKPVDPPPPMRRVIVIDRPGAVQTEIRVGNIGIPRKHDDFMAMDLAAKVLGGEGANRLHRVLRSERGLTYGASADFNALKQAGDIVAQTNTRSETTGETLRLMVDEIWKLIRDRVGDRELEGAQEYLTGSFPLTIETPSQIALQILNAVFFGLNMNDLQTYRERVNAVTADEVQRVARNYLHPDRLTIVLVGDASAFVKQLRGAGFDKFEVIPAAELDLSAPDLRRKPATTRGGFQPAAYVVPSMSNRQRGDEAKALLNKAIAAKGGLAKLQGIKTVKVEGTLTYASAGKPISFPFANYVEYPDRFRSEATMPGGKVTQVFSEGRYWADKGAGAEELSAAESGPIRAAVQRDMVRMLLGAAAGKLIVRSVDAEHAEDPLVAAIEISGDGMTAVTLLINRDNGLIEKASYTGTEGRTEETYSDYRNVSGIQVPFHAVVRRGGLTPIERDVKTIRFNLPLDSALFVKPS